MFDDAKSNNSSLPEVDDIFAETDGNNPQDTSAPASSPTPTPAPSPDSLTSASQSGSSGSANQSVAANSSLNTATKPAATTASSPAGTNISAQRVGLTADDSSLYSDNPGQSPNWFKWALIGIVVVIIILGAYLIYVKFFQTSRVSSVVAPNSTSVSSTKSNPNLSPTASTTAAAANSTTTKQENNPSSNLGSSLTPTTGNVLKTASSSSGLTKATATELLSPSLIDSDSDGLTDVEEKAYGTNPNSVDTDGDNLSDYEEIKIYHTDPLNSDTDGDGYSDGVEVKSGYNPLGAGKMLPLQINSTSTNSGS